ncbi:ABC transporter permease [Synoicihabitans lomoniglobus]|uniref:ABC transporter permease n=1 Tax=Synoicihabitans lomoniglobus TaxID=2909285 RepID=A0AAF0CRX7_9BACT|nr:ABC transporter permease [Opitutaceae bacterium LMO-M01]WED66904.1 ABC transporter permease [Opitutaceae bacterium LMO-M01]
MKPSRLPLVTALVVLVFFYLPIAMLIAQSFNAAKFGGQWNGFSFRWYQELWAREDIHQAAWNTLLIAVTSTIASVVLGALAAWCIHRYKTRTQRIHYGLIYAPLVVPDILMGLSLLFLFVNVGVQLNFTTIILAHTTFCLSYVTLVMLGRLQDFDDAVIEAAQDLGAGWGTIIRRILLPLLGPGLAAGGLLAFTLSIDDFVITFLVSGPGNTTLPVKIFSMMRRSSPQVINALSVIFMSVTFITVLLSQRLTRPQP